MAAILNLAAILDFGSQSAWALKMSLEYKDLIQRPGSVPIFTTFSIEQSLGIVSPFCSTSGSIQAAATAELALTETASSGGAAKHAAQCFHRRRCRRRLKSVTSCIEYMVLSTQLSWMNSSAVLENTVYVEYVYYISVH